MSLFRLKTSEAELASANKGVTDTEWRQFAPSRDVTLDNFHNGAIHIRFDIGGDRWWVPGDTYMRFRVHAKEATGAGTNYSNLTDESDVSLNMFPIACLFQSMEFRINDKVVSRCTDNCAQIESLEQRMSKSKAWMDSIGMMVCNPSPDDRVRKTFMSGAGGTISNQVFKTMVTAGTLMYGPSTTRPDGGGNHIATVAAAGGVDSYYEFAVLADLSAYFYVGQLIWDTINAQYTRITALTNDRIYVADDLGTNAFAPFVDQIRIGRLGAVEEESVPGASYFEMIWKPPLSIFKIPHALPLGKYELVLVPFPNPLYKARMLTCSGPAPELVTLYNGNATAAGAISIGIENMFLYVATLRSAPVMDYAYLIDLEETTCQSQNFTGGASLNQEQFTVSPSTYALTLAFQDNRAGDGNLENLFYSATKFKCGQQEEELNLSRFFINFAGMNKPQPDADPNYDRDPVVVPGQYNRDQTLQRYYENIIQTRGYFNDGGHETWGEWKKRGPYYHFNWPRDGTDRSQRVMVNYQFSAALTNPAKILLFSHFRKVAKVRIENGNVTDVQVNEY